MHSTSQNDVQVAVKAEALLGEGPVWDDRAGILYWVDIKGKRLHTLSPATNGTRDIPLSIETGAVAPRTKGGLIAATRTGFSYLDPDTGRLIDIADPEEDLPTNRFNDGAIDASGNFVAGSMDDLETNPTGTVYRLSPSGDVTTLFGGFVVCNGPAFSADGRTLFFSNSAARELLSFPYDPVDGSVGEPIVFARIEEAHGYPDGLTVDADGGVWCAHWDGGRITRFAADGTVDRIVELPVPLVTSCAFGGMNYGTLYVTSARWRMDADRLERFPLSGSLFAVDVGVKGFPLPLYAG